MTRSFSIGYRTGGTLNFRWHRMLVSFSSKAAAELEAENIRRMGYPAHVYDSRLLDAIGLPDTFAPEDR